MHRIILAVLVAAATGCLVASAQATPCLTIDMLKTEAALQGQGMKIDAIDAAKTEKFLARLRSFNDTFAKLEGSRLAVFHKPNGINVVLFTFDAMGCADQMMPVPADYFAKIISDKGI